jgi:hypothetical protein
LTQELNISLADALRAVIDFVSYGVKCGGRHNFGGTAAFHSTADQSVRAVVPQLRAISRHSHR